MHRRRQATRTMRLCWMAWCDSTRRSLRKSLQERSQQVTTLQQETHDQELALQAAASQRAAVGDHVRSMAAQLTALEKRLDQAVEADVSKEAALQRAWRSEADSREQCAQLEVCVAVTPHTVPCPVFYMHLLSPTCTCCATHTDHC